MVGRLLGLFGLACRRDVDELRSRCRVLGEEVGKLRGVVGERDVRVSELGGRLEAAGRDLHAAREGCRRRVRELVREVDVLGECVRPSLDVRVLESKRGRFRLELLVGGKSAFVSSINSSFVSRDAALGFAGGCFRLGRVV